MTEKLRVMIDANILVAGSLFPRFPYEVLRHAVIGDYQQILTEKIIQEATEAIAKINVTRLPSFEKLLTTLNYDFVATPKDEEIIQNQDLIRDPKDVHVALAPIQASVDFLITQDKDFTARDATTEKLHQQLKILLPGTFLREYLGWSSEALEKIRHRKWQDMK